MNKKHKKLFLKLIKDPFTFILLLLTLSLVLFFYKHLIVYALIVFFAGSLSLMTLKMKVKFSLGHVFFLSMVIAKEMGFIWAVILVIAGEFVPKVIVADLDLKTFILIPIEIGIAFIFATFNSVSILALGFIIGLIYHFIGLVLAKSMGDSFPELIAEVGLPCFMNCVYFFSMAGPMSSVLAFVIAA